MTSADVTTVPVQKVGLLPGTTVGYMLFNSHNAVAETELPDAISQLKTAGATDLVLDVRYNGGGYLDVAAELAYMVSKPSVTAGKTFELTRFNDKHPHQDPVTGADLAPTPFESSTRGVGPNPSGVPLPHLDLDRVYILVGRGTCSASEAIINGLLGVGVNVVLVGNTTCGKPYGFYPQDNCGTTYFTIQFQGVNDKGFGDYADGFIPGGGGQAGPPGCDVLDDFTHELGDPAEGRLAAALAYRANGACPPKAARALAAGGDVRIQRDAFLENRILLRP
jgi:hypothetical protein